MLINDYAKHRMMKDNEQDEIFVKIDLITVKKLAKLASPHEIEPNLLTRIIEHALVCGKWSLDQKEEQI